MHPTQKVTPTDLEGQVRTALRQWHSTSSAESPFASLLLFQQLRQATESDGHEATNRVLLQALHLLQADHPKEASLLRRSFLDNELDERIALDMNISEATLYRHKKKAERLLAEALANLEQQTQATARNRLYRRLNPLSTTELLGVEEPMQQLAQLLTQPEPPYIVALAGMGGIGKTSLADALVRRLIEQDAVADVGWVTAQQTLFQWDGPPVAVTDPALTFDALAEALVAQLSDDDGAPGAPRDAVAWLRQRLSDHPHLIVIDNLETLADIETLVQALRGLAAPTKFLLTSRVGLFNQPDVYHYSVPELTTPVALQLIRQEATARNLTLLQHAPDADLLPIVEAVGGNPLALRLVVGQTVIYPLPVVLENLAAARGERAESLYVYIYRQAWERLDEVARLTLLALPLAPPAGVDLADLAAISEIEQGDLTQALHQLVRLSLVDLRGDLHHRRYSIHNLTRTFLHEQVIRWQSP